MPCFHVSFAAIAAFSCAKAGSSDETVVPNPQAPENPNEDEVAHRFTGFTIRQADEECANGNAIGCIAAGDLRADQLALAGASEEEAFEAWQLGVRRACELGDEQACIYVSKARGFYCVAGAESVLGVSDFYADQDGACFDTAAACEDARVFAYTAVSEQCEEVSSAVCFGLALEGESGTHWVCYPSRDVCDAKRLEEGEPDPELYTRRCRRMWKAPW